MLRFSHSRECAAQVDSHFSTLLPGQISLIENKIGADSTHLGRYGSFGTLRIKLD